MKSIFEYLDYHEYLRDYYLEKKQENSFFSYRYMGMKLELDPGFVAKVLQGKMQLALKSIPALVTFCKLHPREADYFDAMVKFGRSKNEKDVHLYFEQMAALRGVEARRIEQKQYQFYTKCTIPQCVRFWATTGSRATMRRLPGNCRRRLPWSRPGNPSSFCSISVW